MIFPDLAAAAAEAWGWTPETIFWGLTVPQFMLMLDSVARKAAQRERPEGINPPLTHYPPGQFPDANRPQGMREL